jgi:hypothetical protein
MVTQILEKLHIVRTPVVVIPKFPIFFPMWNYCQQNFPILSENYMVKAHRVQKPGLSSWLLSRLRRSPWSSRLSWHRLVRRRTTSCLLDCSVTSLLPGFVFRSLLAQLFFLVVILPHMSAPSNTVSALYCRIACGHCTHVSANSCAPCSGLPGSYLPGDLSFLNIGFIDNM